jgi:parvulin-like peptidyl-prolyl isomerase
MIYYLIVVSDPKEKIMKKFVVLSSVLAVLAAGCARKAENVILKEGTPAYQLAKDLAAKVPSLDPAVNNVLVRAKNFEITAAEVIQTIQDNVGSRTAQLKDMDAGQMKSLIERTAVQLGERRLLLGEALKAKAVVPPGDLDKALKAEYGRAGGEQGFLDALKTNGISIDHVKKSLEEQLLIHSFIQAAFSREAQVKPEDVEKAYGEDKTASVRHILLLTQGKNEQEKAETRKKMEDILAKAKAGEDFTALAKQFSEDPGSKGNGGLYRDFARGAMVKPFEDAAFSVPVGQISGIVETTYGYHILQIVDRKKETRPLNEVRAEIEAGIKKGRQADAFSIYVAKLKEKAGFKTVGY